MEKARIRIACELTVYATSLLVAAGVTLTTGRRNGARAIPFS